VEPRLPCRPRGLIEGVHPLGQVVEVLAIAIPLELLVVDLSVATLAELLADAKAATRGMGLALSLAEAADPAGARVIGAMPAEGMVHLVDQPKRKAEVAIVAGGTGDPDE